MPGQGYIANQNKNIRLSKAELDFLREPENRAFADSLNVNPNYIFPEERLTGPAPKTDFGSRISKDEIDGIKAQISMQQSKLEGAKYFARPTQGSQTTNPLVLQALQRSMAQQPMITGFETQMAQLPQFQQGRANLGAMPESKGAAKLPTGGGFSAFKDLFRQMTGQGAPEFDQPLADYGANYFDKSRFTPYSAPQQMGVSQMGGPQMGGMQGGLLGSLATKGQQQIAAGQAMNPTILKAKSV